MKLMEMKARYDKIISENPDARKKMMAMEKLQWIKSSYAFDMENRGNRASLSDNDIIQIVKGEYIGTRSVQDHVMIKNYFDMVKYIYGVLPLKDKSDLRLMEKINCILCRNELLEESQVNYRKTTLIVKSFNLIPPHYQEIETESVRMLSKYNVLLKQMDPIMRGCYMHNEFLRIYPFAENNEATARGLLNFELLTAGFVPLAFRMDLEEYNKCVAAHINRRDSQSFYELICRSIADWYGELTQTL